MPLGAARADPAGEWLAAVLPVRQERQPWPPRRARPRHLGPRPPPACPQETMTLAIRPSVNNQA